MSPDSSSKLRINLARWKCFSFRITTEAIIEDSLAKDIGLDPKHKFKRFSEEYTRSNIRHIMTLRFARREKQLNSYAIRVIYETVEPEQLAPDIFWGRTPSRPSDIFLQLCNLETPLFLRCDCSFLYRREDKVVYFPLPLKFEGETYDEVRGIRFVKLEQNKVLWENSLDLIEPDRMIHRIKFAHESRCSIDLPQKLLRRAKDVSRRT